MMNPLLTSEPLFIALDCSVVVCFLYDKVADIPHKITGFDSAGEWSLLMNTFPLRIQSVKQKD